MKKASFLMCMALAAAAFADPVVSGVSVSFYQQARLVKVQYSLSEPAVVTAQFLRGGEVVPATNVVSLVGDVNRLVKGSAGVFYWKAVQDFPGETFNANSLSVKLKAWPVDAPPDFMVVDLRGQRHVRYYESADDIPGGLGLGSSDTNRIYKIVMRRIPAANILWRMGSPSDETGRDDNEVPHLVKLTNDYYISVYPVTQGQFAQIDSSKSATWSGSYSVNTATNAALRPMDTVSYNYIRGSVDDSINWPATGTNVLSTSFLGKLRQFTGVDFDLPTEAQWEYAARAGTSGALNDGTANLAVAESGDDANAKRLGWIKQNAVNAYGSTETGPVGWFTPNAWNIYDIHGNVYELCRDWYVADLTTVAGYSAAGTVEPIGPSQTSGSRSFRAGIYAYNVRHCRTAKRGGYSPNNSAHAYGFRLYAPCEAR